jgi:hypothetical protein
MVLHFRSVGRFRASRSTAFYEKLNIHVAFFVYIRYVPLEQNKVVAIFIYLPVNLLRSQFVTLKNGDCLRSQFETLNPQIPLHLAET